MKARDEIFDIDLTTVEIIVLVNEFFKGDYIKTALWLRTKNMNFGDVSPMRLINYNKGHKVLQFIKTAIDESQLLTPKEGNRE